jgi:CRP/FNR family transcriptional regulator
MSAWIDRAEGLEGLTAGARARLGALVPMRLGKGEVLFRPGDRAAGFLLVLSGEVGVYLTGPTGRDILLYRVVPGETCVQTTLGLMSAQDYSGEAVTDSDVEAVMIPKGLFLELMATSEPFRQFVFAAFAERLQSIMHVLEQVAFIKVEERLAAALLDRADGEGNVTATHQGLATAIGSAREVVSRQLESFRKKGLVDLDRGGVRITDKSGLMGYLKNFPAW